ncbi:hypothetical protein [Paraburkholderia sp. SIMBA_054]|uniref:hypothetical protein n=1 Tax=Paraburkholderia sp. SIMBA_054 TaxID=3085795 RepID=UPI00397A6EE3
MTTSRATIASSFVTLRKRFMCRPVPFAANLREIAALDGAEAPRHPVQQHRHQARHDDAPQFPVLDNRAPVRCLGRD